MLMVSIMMPVVIMSWSSMALLENYSVIIARKNLVVRSLLTELASVRVRDQFDQESFYLEKCYLKQHLIKQNVKQKSLICLLYWAPPYPYHQQICSQCLQKKMVQSLSS